MADLARSAVDVLRADGPNEKVALSRALARDWREGRIPPPGGTAVPERPGRPERPLLVPPRAVPKRRISADSRGRIALLHAVAHIELNAIDLAWDMVARFAGHGLPRAFADDWVGVASDEAEHFALLSARLGRMGAAYGDLPAHDGLWQAARRTAHDLLARLAVVPMVLEARGLDVTPAMIDKFAAAGDAESAAILRRIYADEIAHVAAGTRWFRALCRERTLDETQTWRDLVERHCGGALKPPYNIPARERAGMPPALYLP